MVFEWSPFVERSLVSIDENALIKILQSFEKLSKIYDESVEIFAILHSKGGTISDVSSLSSRKIEPTVLTGTYKKGDVPSDMIFRLNGYPVVFVLNPFFGEPPKKVRIGTLDDRLVALFEADRL